jgi:hypothetical protein
MDKSDTIEGGSVGSSLLPDSWADRTRHPVWLAAGLAVAAALLGVIAGALVGLLFPDSDTLVRRLTGVLVLAVAAVVVVAATGGWRRTGTQGANSWQHLALLIVPALVALDSTCQMPAL